MKGKKYYETYDHIKSFDNMITNIAYEQGEQQKGWTQLRAEFEGAVYFYLKVYK